MKNQTKEWSIIVGRNIRSIRIRHRETQAKLGEIIGYSATAVANYERGDRLPDLVTAYMIAQHYQVMMEKLMEDDFTNREYKQL